MRTHLTRFHVGVAAALAVTSVGVVPGAGHAEIVGHESVAQPDDVSTSASPTTAITGRIVASADGAPLPSIEIGILARNSAGELRDWRTATDEFGEFAVDVSDFDTEGNPYEVVVLDRAGEYVSEFGIMIAVQEGYAEPIEVRLDEGEPFRGFVRDTAAGRPVEGVCVVVEDLAGGPVIPTDFAECSRDDGSYQTLAVDPGTYQLRAASTAVSLSAVTGPVVAGSEVDILVERREIIINGFVTEAETGDPIEGVEITAAATTFDQPEVAPVLTDADGFYSIDATQLSTTFPIQIDATDPLGRFAPTSGMFVSPQPGYVEPLSFTMDRGGSIAGTVTDTEGRAVPNAGISIFPLDGQSLPFSVTSARTGLDGTYSTRGLPAGEYEVSVFVNSPSYGSAFEIVQVDVGTTTTLDLVLESFGPAFLSGTVTDELGQPAGDVQLRILESGTNNAVAIAETLSDGRYAIGIPPGTYDVVALASERRSAFATDVVVESSTTLDLGLVSLDGISVPVSGTIAVPDGWTGSVFVECIAGFGNSGGGFADIGADGSYEFVVEPISLAPCEWSVFASGPSFDGSFNVSRPLELAPYDPITVDLDATAGEFVFSVVDDTGAPFPSGFVRGDLQGTVPFADGVVGAFRSDRSGSDTSEVAITSWDATQLEYFLSDPIFVGDVVDVSGLDAFELVISQSVTTVTGTIDLPVGVDASVFVDCNGQFASAPVIGGSYSLDVARTGSETFCFWSLSGSSPQPGAFTSFSVNRDIVLSSDVVDVSLGAPSEFVVEVVDDLGDPVTVDFLFGSVDGTASFTDGVRGSASAGFDVFGGTSATLLVWEPDTIFAEGNTSDGAGIFVFDDVVDPAGYQIAVTSAPGPIVSGVVPAPDGGFAEVGIACGFGFGSSVVEPDGSYEVQLPNTADGQFCQWDYSAFDGAGVASTTVSREIVAADGAVVDLAPGSGFEISIVDQSGNPLTSSFFASLSGSVAFPDGTVGWFSSDAMASDVSSVVLPSWDAEFAFVEGSTSAGIDFVESSDAIGDSFEVVVELPDETPPMVEIVGVADGDQFLVGSTVTPSCVTTDDESGVAEPATLTVVSPLRADGAGVATATCSGAIDVAGNVAPPVSVSYTFVYRRIDGVFTKGGLADAPTVNTGNAGKTFQLRWTLATADGSAITASDAVVGAESFVVQCDGFESLVDAPTGSGSSLGPVAVTGSGEFRWSYKTPMEDGCQVVVIELADTTEIVVKFDTR